MKIYRSEHPQGWRYVCACGFQTEPRFTFEAAGREYDLHLAAAFPLASKRFPCTEPGESVRSFIDALALAAEQANGEEINPATGVPEQW